MPDWLTIIESALDECERPAPVFFRDDDAGWVNHRLNRMMDVFAGHETPLDLAVIPSAINADLVDELLTRRRQTPELIGIHQHGFSHDNHEPEHERKCEFGPSQNQIQQQTDLDNGRKLMTKYFGAYADPIFTPPWNRCTQLTIDHLENTGFEILSRDLNAEQLKVNKLKHAPVGINWSRLIKTGADPETGIATAFVNSIRSNAVTGLMFHHADMTSEHLPALSDFLRLISPHPNTRTFLIRDIACRCQ